MKKFLTTTLAILTTAVLASCGKGKKETTEGFTPALDTSTTCNIKVVGDYDSFPELVDEFKEFNNYYPNVRLTYTKITGLYEEMIGTVLEGNEKPNIFFAYTWMVGNKKYANVESHMEDLSDPALKINLSCIRPGLVNSKNTLMVPLFGRSYGMLVNNDLFKKENLNVPNSFNELLTVCDAFLAKGYKNPMMGYSKEVPNNLMNTVAYPAVVASLANNAEALALANENNAAAGAYMRDAFNIVDQLAKKGAFNVCECDLLADNYDKVIMRFLKGDVPMMICADDTPSGTKKRESRSEEFIANPFSYSYAPIPITSDGGYFIDNPSKLLSVNKNCDNLDMTNEFMRFLVSSEELNSMAAKKNLLSSTNEISFDSIYAPFGKVPANKTFSPEGLGFKDIIKEQVRKAVFKIAIGTKTSEDDSTPRTKITVDEAVVNYGSF